MSKRFLCTCILTSKNSGISGGDEDHDDLMGMIVFVHASHHLDFGLCER